MLLQKTQRNKMLLLVLATLLAALALHPANAYQEYATVIAVYNSTGESAIVNCSNGTNYHYKINDLPLGNITSGTLLRLCSKSFILTKNLSLSNLENIALVGYNSPTVKCDKETSLGIVLGAIRNLELHNFTVDGCGVMTTIDSKADHNIKSGVIIQNSTNITVTGVNITKSPGSGLALFRNNGSVRVENSVFEKNGIDRLTGGNGIYMETGSSFPSTSTVAEYTFAKCDFLFNTAATGKDNIIAGFSRFDKGGGLCVYIRASEKHKVTILNSRFIGNRAEHYGGGLFVSYLGKARDNIVRVLNCNFSLNTATFGGGTYGGYLHTRLQGLETPLNCSHIYEYLNFTENQATFGGGSSVFASKTLNRNSNAHVNFVNCTWMRNIGQYGAAVTILPNAWNLYTEGYLPTPRFVGCTISNNHVKFKTMFKNEYYAEYSKGSGAFYCYGHNVSFEKQTLIENNQGSAMYLGSCLAIFYENSITYFVNNTGYQGGAIYELSSVVYVQDNSALYFSANKAEDKGGAIYEHSFFMHIYDYSKTCFIDYIDNFTEVTERNISVTFIDNVAGKYGHSIYTSSLRPCYNRFSFSAANLSVDIFDQVGNFTYFPENRSMEIATAINHSNITAEHWSENLLFIPGKRMRLPFVDVDDLNQAVRTSYLVTIQNGSRSNVTVSPDYTDISNNMLLLYGKDSTTVTLSDTSSRQIALTFEITMQACPPGFIHDDVSQGCICSAGLNESYAGIEHCKVSLMRAYSKYGYWIGYMENKTENDSSLISAYYNPTENFSNPTGYGRLLPETANRTELNDIMCNEARTGFLCSQCMENMTVHFHSREFACKSNKYCTFGWLFYILSEIVPVTIIFLVIIYFNISFTSGLVNGFIFYCQMVEVIQIVSNGFISLSETAQIVNKVHTFIYLSTTLNLFFLEDLSFCLWENASAMSIAAFSNVTLFYALVLVVLVTFVFRNCSFRCTCRRSSSGYFPLALNPNFQGSILHGLAAFLILCYAHCGHSSLPLLLSVSVYSKGPTVYQTMVNVQPDIEWFSPQHLPYAMLSLLLVFFMLFLPPILLVVYPLHYKVLAFLRIAEFRCVQIVFSPLDKLKPFFDSFQSCFKDKFRFFSGLYFIYRFSMIVIVFNHSAQVSFFFIEVQLVIMLTLHALCQPYKEQLHNVIDTLLFCNLAVINAITYYNVSASMANVRDLNLLATTWLQTILIILPLPIMLVFLFAHTPCVRACRRTSISVPIEEDDLPDRMQVNYYQARDN